MKIRGMKGDFAFKALYHLPSGWVLSEQYFFSIEDVGSSCGPKVQFIWPVEIGDNGEIYVPSEDELCQ